MILIQFSTYQKFFNVTTVAHLVLKWSQQTLILQPKFKVQLVGLVCASTENGAANQLGVRMGIGILDFTGFVNF